MYIAHLCFSFFDEPVMCLETTFNNLTLCVCLSLRAHVCLSGQHIYRKLTNSRWVDNPREEGELSSSTLLYDISLLCTYSTHSFVLWTVKGIGRVFDIKLYHTIPLLWDHHTISYHAIPSPRGLLPIGGMFKRTNLALGSHFFSSFLSVYVCVGVWIVCAWMFVQSVRRSTWTCAFAFAFAFICMCLSVCVTQPRPFSYFSSFLLRELHASLSFLPSPPPHENHPRYLSVI